MLLFGIVAGVVAGLLACASLGGYVAHTKARSPVEGAVFGLLLGPLGITIEAMLPTLEPPAGPEPETPHIVDADAWDLHEIMGMPVVDPRGPLREARPSRRTGSSG